jgi:phosphoadenosine phosphosulfate reductase
MDRLSEFRKDTVGLGAHQIVRWAIETFGRANIILASSFSAEDQILTDMIIDIDSKARVFTLDTGRHFEDTYVLWQKSVDHWDINYEIGFPDPAELSALIKDNGPDLFYKNIESRKACCTVRKTNPLKKILSTVDAWIVGLRGEQSITREGLSPVEWDAQNGIYRISPLYNWTEVDVFKYARKQMVPLTELYKKGFRSIGCAPCSRPIAPFDDIRAGRWWWEKPEHKECGLHNRKSVRALEK